MANKSKTAKVNIGYEVLSEVISQVSVLATNDNKVRLTIGTKTSGNALVCSAVIVNGPVMLDRVFLTNPMADPVDLTDGPYMNFILKAREFVSYAGALLPYKADVTLSDGDGKVHFSIGNSTKVPVSKVSPESAEPLLQKDYDAREVILSGEQLLETLEKGGFPSTLDGGAPVIIKLSGGQMDVYGISHATFAHFACPVKAQYTAKADAAAPLEKREENAPVMDARHFLVNHVKTLTDEAQIAGMKEEIALRATDPAALEEYARSLGFSPDAKRETEQTPKAQTDGSASFSLTAASLKLLTKLFAGCRDAKFIVTPKNLHVAAGKSCAAFALAEGSDGYLHVVDNLERAEKTAHVMVDRDALSGTLQLMKLGDPKNPFCITATKSGLCLRKHGEDITGSVAILGSDGDLSTLNSYFSATLFGSAMSVLKPGNVTLSLGGIRAPLMMRNGGLSDDEVTGHVAIMGVKPPVEIQTEAAGITETDSTQEAKE